MRNRDQLKLISMLLLAPKTSVLASGFCPLKSLSHENGVFNLIELHFSEDGGHLERKSKFPF